MRCQLDDYEHICFALCGSSGHPYADASDAESSVAPSSETPGDQQAQGAVSLTLIFVSHSNAAGIAATHLWGRIRRKSFLQRGVSLFVVCAPPAPSTPPRKSSKAVAPFTATPPSRRMAQN